MSDKREVSALSVSPVSALGKRETKLYQKNNHQEA